MKALRMNQSTTRAWRSVCMLGDEHKQQKCLRRQIAPDIGCHSLGIALQTLAFGLDCAPGSFAGEPSHALLHSVLERTPKDPRMIVPTSNAGTLSYAMLGFVFSRSQYTRFCSGLAGIPTARCDTCAWGATGCKLQMPRCRDPRGRALRRARRASPLFRWRPSWRPWRCSARRACASGPPACCRCLLRSACCRCTPIQVRVQNILVRAKILALLMAQGA